MATLVSMLGIKQVSILVNKMDLVDYSEERFNEVRDEYTRFLKQLNVEPQSFIPISAFEGENIVKSSEKMPWFTDRCVLDQVDEFKKAEPFTALPFRMPVQDVYNSRSRRMTAGL